MIGVTKEDTRSLDYSSVKCLVYLDVPASLSDTEAATCADGRLAAMSADACR